MLGLGGVNPSGVGPSQTPHDKPQHEVRALGDLLREL